MFSLDAENAHHLTLRMLSLMPPFTPPPTRPSSRSSCGAWTFRNPIGLAAGMDKDAIAIRAWQSLGFGFAELGTITPRPQAGNETPRLWRIPDRHALINRLGFPSEGMEAVAPRIERMRKAGGKIRIALNFGPNKDTPAEQVAADYSRADGAARADGGFHRDQRQLAEHARTAQLAIAGANERNVRRDAGASGESARPMLVKIAPDLDRNELLESAIPRSILGVDGMVVCNTTLAREASASRHRSRAGSAGIRCGSRARAIRDVIRTRRAKCRLSASAAS